MSPTIEGRGQSSLVAMLLLPIVLVNLVAFIAPMVNLALLSFRVALPGGALGEGTTMANWTSVLTDWFYIETLLFTVAVGLLITVLTLLCSYPLALLIHHASPTWRGVLVVACISPLLVSAVVRTYGWLVILGDRGVIPNLSDALFGIRPPRLVFNTTGVVIGLTEILMPYMTLALLAGFGRLDRAYEEAASSLGARPFTVFRRVVLPLTLPGIFLGCLLTFVLAISSFITPKLLGGGRVFLLATEIYDQAIVTLNWPVAAVLSMVVLVVFGATLAVYGRIARAAG